MTLIAYVREVDRVLSSRQCPYRCHQIDDQWLRFRFSNGHSPVSTAIEIQQLRAKGKTQPPPAVPPADPSIAARARQPQQVLLDPKYMLNTGLGFGCPQCGSTSILTLGKAGSGFGFFGSIGWVVAASALDTVFAMTQPTNFKCNYCNCTFQVRP